MDKDANNRRWANVVAPFLSSTGEPVAAPTPATAPEGEKVEPRPWMVPCPTQNYNASTHATDWQAAWAPTVNWAQRHAPENYTAMRQAEAAWKADPDNRQKQHAVSRHYLALNQLWAAYLKTQPLIRF